MDKINAFHSAGKGPTMRVTIRTGGQTGVDRAALKLAVDHHLSYGGWCPRGGWAEDRQTPPGILTDYPRLTETPSAVPEQRTAWNVRDSHATLILYRGDPERLVEQSLGTWFTRRCAEEVFLRPCLLMHPESEAAVATTVAWLRRVHDGLGLAEMILNIAGPRASQDEGIEEVAYQLLDAVLQQV
jgi:hypothetical protein